MNLSQIGFFTLCAFAFFWALWGGGRLFERRRWLTSAAYGEMQRRAFNRSRRPFFEEQS